MVPYKKSPFREIDLVCQSCGATSTDRYVHPFCPVFVCTNGNQPGTLRPGQDQPICGECYEQWLETHSVWRPFAPPADIDGLVLAQLKFLAEGQRKTDGLGQITPFNKDQKTPFGLRQHEINADLSRVPLAVLAAFPPLTLKGLLSGHFSRVPGVGLLGRAERGKTMGLAALLKTCLTANAQNLAPFVHLRGECRKIAWMNMKETFASWRLEAIDPQVAVDVHHASTVRLLIMDDVGRECPNKEHSARMENVDAIITARDRSDLPTLWTSNVEPKVLEERYGAPLYRRLTRLNPPVWIEG